MPQCTHLSIRYHVAPETSPVLLFLRETWPCASACLTSPYKCIPEVLLVLKNRRLFRPTLNRRRVACQRTGRRAFFLLMSRETCYPVFRSTCGISICCSLRILFYPVFFFCLYNHLVEARHPAGYLQLLPTGESDTLFHRANIRHEFHVTGSAPFSQNLPILFFLATSSSISGPDEL